MHISYATSVTPRNRPRKKGFLLAPIVKEYKIGNKIEFRDLPWETQPLTPHQRKIGARSILYA